jgi:Transglutaminase-like superfamily
LLEPAAAGKNPEPVQAPPPEAALSDDGTGAGRVGLTTVFAFVVASVFAKFVLRFWRFERVVNRVAARNARHRDPARPFDLERARQLMDAFARLRVFLFSTREECLHDSLAVLEFLARHDLFPSWVFAVRARPFAAHCWVQHAGVICNDTVEHVSGYVPIMVV